VAATRPCRGIGSSLFRPAEACAIAAGAKSIHLASSPAAVQFYNANGFEETVAASVDCRRGRSMACGGIE